MTNDEIAAAINRHETEALLQVRLFRSATITDHIAAHRRRAADHFAIVEGLRAVLAHRNGPMG